MRHTTRRNALMPLVALYAVSLVPGAHAYCYRDRFGVEHCTLSTGARIGIAIAAVVGFLIVLMALRTARQRRTRQANMAYVNTSAVAGAVPPGYPPQGGPPGFPPPGAPPGFAPQGGPPGIPPRGGYPEYAPPQGPPPGSPPQAVYQAGSYFPYTQGAPAQYADAPNASPPQALQYPPQSYDGQASYAAPPPGPPPGWSPHPDYAAPTGPPPTGDHKHAV